MQMNETYEDLLFTTTKEIEELEKEQKRISGAHYRWLEIEKQLERLEGRMQTIEYVAFNKIPDTELTNVIQFLPRY